MGPSCIGASWSRLGPLLEPSLGPLLRPSWGFHGALQSPPKGSHRKTPRGAPSLGCQVGAPQVDSPKGGPRGPKEGPKIGQEGPQVSPSLGGPLGRGRGPSAAPAGSSGGLLCGSPSASCVLPLLTTPLLPCIPIHSAEFGNTSDSPPVPGQTTLSGSSTRQIPDFTRQMEPRKMRRKRERRRTEEEDHLHVRPHNRRGHFENSQSDPTVSQDGVRHPQCVPGGPQEDFQQRFEKGSLISGRGRFNRAALIEFPRQR